MFSDIVLISTIELIKFYIVVCLMPFLYTPAILRSRTYFYFVIFLALSQP